MTQCSAAPGRRVSGAYWGMSGGCQTLTSSCGATLTSPGPVPRDRVPEIPFIPNKQVYILTCIDPRVDPAQVFGLELGDAIVARTVGGRVTKAVIQDLAWICYLHETKTPDADWFEFAVMHHTDCGSGFYADDDLRHGFAARGFDDAELAGLAVLDPAVTVPVDVEKVTNAPQVSSKVTVSGFSYDVKTGLVTTVVPPRSR